MSPWRSLFITVHLSALGIWLGVTAGVAATAAIAFPTARDLGVRVLDLPESAAMQHRFVAGAIAERVFLFGDTVGFGCAMLAAVSMGALLAMGAWSPRRIGTIVRALSLGVALAAFASLLLIVTPGINAASKRHLAAARAGDVAAAGTHAEAVDDLHPLASRLIAAQAAGVFVALVGGLWSVSRRAGPDGDPAAIAMPARLPAPALLKGRRL